MKTLIAFLLFIIGYCVLTINDPAWAKEGEPKWWILGYVIMGLAFPVLMF